MKLLLDTHVVLWWLSNPSTISIQAQQAISNRKNQAFISSATIWEMSIKSSLGKLAMPDNLEEVMIAEDFECLPIFFSHASLAGHLPIIHKDPFDRMLIAQAKIEHLTIVTRDDNMLRYEAVSFIIA